MPDMSAHHLCFSAKISTCRQFSLPLQGLRLCAVCHVSVAMVTGEVPARAGEAEGRVGESAEGGGRGGEEVPRGGVFMLEGTCCTYDVFFVCVSFVFSVANLQYLKSE